MADPIFWIEWLLGGERLVFTTGKSVHNIRSSETAIPYAVVPGYYALYAIKTDGHGLKFLFKGREMDARLAQPTVSPDGGHVAVVATVDSAPRVMIVATNAAKATPLAEVGATSHASWLPRSTGLGGGEPSPGLCRTVVF